MTTPWVAFTLAMAVSSAIDTLKAIIAIPSADTAF